MTPPKTRKSRIQKTATGELRIIGGQWKRTPLTFPLLEGVRPTPSRIRETLFNWLAGVINRSNCLDLFAGSGALGFEALSRGAKQVWMIDQSAEICQTLRSHASRLDASGAKIIQGNALDPNTLDIEETLDVVFCDPPFHKDHLKNLLIKLAELNLANDALIYIESEQTLTEIQVPENWSLLKEKTAGDVRYRLYQHSP